MGATRKDILIPEIILLGSILFITLREERIENMIGMIVITGTIITGLIITRRTNAIAMGTGMIDPATGTVDEQIKDI